MKFKWSEVLKVCCTVMLVLLAGCAANEIRYTASSETMSVNEARAAIERGFKIAYVGIQGDSAVSIVHEIRFRKTGFGLALQRGEIDWSLFNNVKFDAPGVKACYFADVPANPVVIDTGALGDMAPCNRYFVQVCNINLGFCKFPPAKDFVDALFVLKQNSRR